MKALREQRLSLNYEVLSKWVGEGWGLHSGQRGEERNHGLMTWVIGFIVLAKGGCMCWVLWFHISVLRFSDFLICNMSFCTQISSKILFELIVLALLPPTEINIDETWGRMEVFMYTSILLNEIHRIFMCFKIAF